MIALCLAAVLGGLLTTALLWPYGVVVALLAYPIGGSGFAILAAALVFAARSRREDTVRLRRTQAHSGHFVLPLRATARLSPA